MPRQLRFESLDADGKADHAHRELLHALERIRKLEEAIEQLRNDRGRLVGEVKDLTDKLAKIHKADSLK